MVYDAAHQTDLLFGGVGAAGAELGDTWLWDGAKWSLAAAGGGPAPRSLAAMAYDDARQEAVLFGGVGDDGALGDTWRWDGAQWTRVATDGPSARSSAAMTYDSGRQRITLFGGQPAARLGDPTAHGGAIVIGCPTVMVGG